MTSDIDAESMFAGQTGRAGTRHRLFDVGPLAGWRRILPMATGLLVVAIVVQELRRPKEERTWHGTIVGFVPYDLRRPTFARIKETYWNPESHTLFPGRAFGIGWGLNVFEAQRRLRSVWG